MSDWRIAVIFSAGLGGLTVPAGAAGDPTAPDPRPERTTSSEGPRLSSVLLSGERKLAIIDGAVLEEGETANGLTLIEVSENEAVIRMAGGRVARLQVGMASGLDAE